MLFSRTVEPSCSYCKRGKSIDGETILCKRKGVTAPGDFCRSFRCDLLKRTPPRPVLPDFSRFREEDFTL